MCSKVIGFGALLVAVLLATVHCPLSTANAQYRSTFGSYYSGGYGSFDPNRKIDGHIVNGIDQYNAGRMAELPQGAQRLCLWVVLSPQFRSSPLEDRTARWFTGGPNFAAQDPRLDQIKQGCQWNYYYSTNPLFAQSGLITAVGTATPIVCLTKPDGQVVSYLNARTLSTLSSPGELADLLVAGIEQANPPPQFDGQRETTQFVRAADCPDGQCTPTPPPAVNPAPPPRVDGVLPEVVPVSPAMNAAPALVATAAVGIVGAIAIAWLAARGQRRTFTLAP